MSYKAHFDNPSHVHPASIEIHPSLLEMAEVNIDEASVIQAYGVYHFFNKMSNVKRESKGK